MLELVGQYERGERQTPAQLVAALPDAVRTAIAQRDEAAFAVVMEALPDEERQRVEALLASLQADEEVATQPAAAQGPDMPRALQEFAPLLGDIALAAFGDATAQALAEEALPGMEQRGWHLTEPAQRIWAGERDADALTATIDLNSAQLVRRVLDLLAMGQNFIVAARSQQLASLRHQAEQATAQALQGNDTQARTALAQQLADLAQQAEGAAQSEHSPWRALASDLRALATRLEEGEPENSR